MKNTGKKGISAKNTNLQKLTPDELLESDIGGGLDLAELEVVRRYEEGSVSKEQLKIFEDEREKRLYGFSEKEIRTLKQPSKSEWAEVANDYESHWGKRMIAVPNYIYFILAIASPIVMIYPMFGFWGFLIRFIAFLILYYSLEALFKRQGHWNGYVDGYAEGYEIGVQRISSLAKSRFRK